MPARKKRLVARNNRKRKHPEDNCQTHRLVRGDRLGSSVRGSNWARVAL